MALMKLQSFARSVDYEKRRHYNSSYISDVYDSEAWQEQMQEPDLSASGNEMDIEIEDDGMFICYVAALFCSSSSWLSRRPRA